METLTSVGIHHAPFLNSSDIAVGERLQSLRSNSGCSIQVVANDIFREWFGTMVMGCRARATLAFVTVNENLGDSSIRERLPGRTPSTEEPMGFEHVFYLIGGLEADLRRGRTGLLCKAPNANVFYLQDVQGDIRRVALQVTIEDGYIRKLDLNASALDDEGKSNRGCRVCCILGTY